jgi:hypothetical protein
MGSRGPLTGVPDTQGQNPGNWTVSFTPDLINSTMPQFEISHIVIEGAPGSSFQIYIDLQKWDNVINGTQNSWDPEVALPLTPGNSVYFYWSDSDGDGNPPQVTIWLRYDQDVYANQQTLAGQRKF